MIKELLPMRSPIIIKHNSKLNYINNINNNLPFYSKNSCNINNNPSFILKKSEMEIGYVSCVLI
jgi:hypothetical protein